ncbi:hypothetical protein [Aminipila terrae]|uniref:Uncharacterized protein n=1 Tax=Aminipila terrae TaxID=2697030 RepID=A0A6P1MIR5_9FIRM|nr:hypothetical protein [Aminipila terrae]QHI72504.1 hypothetical protein Ami3637_08945 [Aminipila terrae]
MITIIKDNSGKVIVHTDLTKEELSAYNLYTINGCIQAVKKAEPAFIGSYH